MAKLRILILPGASSPTASARYREVYATIEQEASQRDYEFKTLLYPGHSGESSGSLSFNSAYDSANAAAASFQPSWLIARSFGCDIAIALLASSAGWVDECDGAVLWGPWVWAQYFRTASTDKKRAEIVRSYAEYGTILAADIFETIPPLEEKIHHARCDLRLARGTRDRETRRCDLECLAKEHSLAQPDHIQQIVEIGGLGHEVVSSRISAELMGCYLACLFDPIALGL